MPSIVTENDPPRTDFSARWILARSCTTLPLAFADGFSAGWVRGSASQPASSMPEVPSGLKGLTSRKYIVRGDGHIASDIAPMLTEWAFGFSGWFL